MWPYWLLFIVPAWAAIQESQQRSSHINGIASLAAINNTWRAVIVALTLMIGWRHEVGGDWVAYFDHLSIAKYESQYLEWWLNDPGYRLIEWLAVQNNWEIYAVNLIAAAIFSSGLVWFCLNLPRPWLGLAVAIPYLVIILGMGYTRQGLALGWIMAALTAFGNSRIASFLVLTILGATFHKSAVLLLPLAALATTKRRVLTLLWVAVAVALSYRLLLEQSVESLRTGYLDAGYESEGALVRLLMNVVPAVLFLFMSKRFLISQQQERLWICLAVASLALLVGYFVSPSSTAVDRVGLYLLPFQLMVFSYLPEAMSRRSTSSKNLWVISVLAYYATVEFVWLNYAKTAFAWLPYRWYPLE